MIRFINKFDDKDELLSYDELAKDFLNSPQSEKGRGFMIGMILFLDFIAKKKGLKFVRLQKADWTQLILAATRVRKSFDKNLLY